MVTNAFIGQPKSDGQSTHTVDQGTSRGMFSVMGFGNERVLLTREALTENVRAVQLEQDLKPIEHLEGDGLMFTIEMETGTGKTYTYIKTMYELNKRYGWTKFIIVVPSIAIREGVYKSFQSMSDHFLNEYGKPIQYFIYNSKQLKKIDSFAEDPGLHVMIINTQAFNSSFDEEKASGNRGEARIIFSRRDEFGSRRPIDILAQTNPIMIIDEPQSVLGVDKKNKTRKGLQNFNPLFTLLYSATHRKGDIYNMLYRLDAIDAYNRKLVKKIEVKGVHQVGTTATNGFLFLHDIVIGKGNPQARISFDTKTATGTKQVTRLVDEGSNLYEQSGGLAEYKDNYIIERIDGQFGTINLLNGLEINEGDSIGAVDEDIIRRHQIRETIRTHIQRERQLFAKHIKVLSLFFIDHVDSYRLYDAEDSRGKFAKMFEEEYLRVLQEMTPQFTDAAYMRYLSDPRNAPDRVHQGYFAQDKKGRMIDSKEGKESANDESAFDLIMKDKERLLSFEEPVRFLFSHSALKEGWDNPNVFQICTLKNSDNETKKRQEVGRGMRLCVNDKGERQDADVLGDNVFDTNVLTVIASESYENFSKALQHEIAEACDTRPVDVTPTLFAEAITHKQDGTPIKITTNMARDIHESLIGNGYVKRGKLTDKYFNDKKEGTLDFGEEINEIKDFVVGKLNTVFNPAAVTVENARKNKEATFNKENFSKKQFQELWKRINAKTYYNVSFETPQLIKNAIKEIDDHLSVTEIKIIVEQGGMESIRDRESLEAGIAMEQGKSRTIHVTEAIGDSVTYDLVGDLVTNTGLTRRTIIEILRGIAPMTFHQFKRNPEEFIAKTSKIINDCKALAVIQYIKYEKMDGTYSTDIFTESTLRGKLGVNAIESTKSLYDLVVVDSMGVEKNFAEELEKNEEVEVYTKLPRGFYINTPMGKYNPDWAVAFKEGTVKHLYFVAETKGNDLESSQLRGSEGSKIECARRHFDAISTSNLKYGVVKDYQKLYDMVAK